MGRDNLQQPAYVLYFSPSGTSFISDTEEEYGICHQIIEESPLCIECRVKEIISLGSHDMFIADVVNVKADDKYLDAETGKFDMGKANLLVYEHGGYYETGKKIGKFGWSVEKKK